MHWYEEHMAQTEPNPECYIKNRTSEELLRSCDSPYENSLVLEVVRLRRLLARVDLRGRTVAESLANMQDLLTEESE